MGRRDRFQQTAPDLRLEQASNYVLRFEKLITTLALDCINLPVERIDQAVDHALEALGEFTGADRSYVFEIKPGGTRLRNTHEWCAAGIEPRLGELDDLSLGSLPWFSARLADREVVYVPDIAALPDEAAAERSFLAGYGVQTLLTVPICNASDLYGFLGFHAVRSRRQWRGDVIALLQIIAESLANALERRRTREALKASEERFELAMLGAQDGYWDWDVENDSVYYSPQFRELLGYGGDDLGSSSLDWRDMIHPEDVSTVERALARHLAGESESVELDHRLRRADGDYRWMTSRVKAVRDGGGRLRRVVGTVVDVTERQDARDELRREQVRSDITLQSLDDGVLITDASGRVRYMNPAAEALCNRAAEEVEARPITEVLDLIREDTEERIACPVHACLRDETVVRVRDPAALRHPDGGSCAIEVTASPLRDAEGDQFGAVAVVRDVSVNRRLTRRLAYQASHDLLTGLVNRREFEVRLRRAMRYAARRGQEHMLCYFDLDQFKLINDTCGHAAGDAMLGQLGQLLREQLPATDSLGRLGGDEFGVLMEDCGPEEGFTRAEKIRELISEFRFTWEGQTFKLGVSIGLVPVDGSFDNASQLLSVADSACFEAKEAGRNRIYEYRAGDRELERRRGQLRWVNRLNNALEETRFELHRQRIQPLSAAAEGNGGEHYELLLRMRGDDGQLIHPESFITAAERFGVMGKLDRWVLSRAFGWLHGRGAEERGMVSINLSGHSLGDLNFLAYVMRLQERYDVPHERICFEVTETAAIANLAHAGKFISTLKGLGCRFALDDFGTGMASFGYLKHLPVDYLKIDGSFVKDMVEDPVDREMVRSINEIGHITGKLTIAEYAETEEILAILREIGVDYAQGYAIAYPEPLI